MKTFLSVEEMRCKSGAAYPAEWVPTRLARLRVPFDLGREKFGQAIKVLSGYRSPARNHSLRETSIAKIMRDQKVSRDVAEKRTGVAKASKHIEGIAVDIRPDGLPPSSSKWTAEDWKEFDRMCRVFHALGVAGQLPTVRYVKRYAGGWLHIDVRANGTPKWAAIV